MGSPDSDSYSYFDHAQVNTYREMNALITFHFGKLKMNQQLKGASSFILNKSITIKDKKIVKYKDSVCLFLHFMGYKRFHKADVFLKFMRRRKNHDEN